MFVDPVLHKLPQQSFAWTCKWFALICYLSVVLIALGLSVIPGVYGIVAVLAGVASLFFHIGIRLVHSHTEGASC